MTKKNVLFIAVDDLRPQLGCYGVDWIQSPHIDALAAEGTVFQHAFCQQAICGPSRASVLSGCRPDTTTIYNLETKLRDAMPDVVSLPQYFKQQGYETVSIGKIYHHKDDDLEGWSKEPVISKGDWQGRGYLTDEAIEVITAGDKERAERGDKRCGLGPAFEAADVADEDYHDGKDALAAIAELDRLAKAEDPFFLALGFHKPHLPFNAPKKYWDMYQAEDLPLAKNPFFPKGMTEYSLADFGELRGYFGVAKEGPIPDDFARQLIHGYSACVTYMDAQLGKVIQKLKDLGLYEDTVIMLWGDHGWKLGEHASWCKHSNYEIDTRAPLIVRSPELTGNNCSALVEFIDMYPTLCDLAGLDISSQCEGRSLKPLMHDPSANWVDAAYSQYPRGGGVMGYTMRTARYRYTEWLAEDRKTVLARELYDHSEDDMENENILDSADASLLATLSEQLFAWRN